MKRLTQLVITILLLGWAALPSQAAFTSVYVFGDALSTTTNNAAGLQPGYDEMKDYYGGRYCNGRVWVEVLAQRLGTTVAYNWSYYDCDSADLANNVNNSKNFNISPSTAANALFVVWGNNADLFDVVANGNASSQSAWNNAINTGTNDELLTIKSLYGKGVQTLVMPNVVDISQVPYFSQNYNTASLQMMHNESIAYNLAFSNMLNIARAQCPLMTIYEPDFFTLLNNVLANGTAYGLTNALLYNGTFNATIDALEYYDYKTTTNSLGTNFIYWDDLDPSAKLHEIMADETKQMIAPVQISQETPLSPQGASICTNVLTLVNVPVGLSGFVEGMTNLSYNGSVWTTMTNFASIAPVQPVFVNSPALPPIALEGITGSIYPGGGSGNGPVSTNAIASYWQAYRLRFPMAWYWP
jgi:phospholipase/lecithinase/hemolysin